MIRFEQVVKSYGARPVVDNLTMEIAEGEFCTLVGPSGCGKSTILKLVNRLEDPDQGRVLIGGSDNQAVDVVTLRRGIGYVFQAGGLFPHYSVTDNVAVVPRLLGWDEGRVQEKVSHLLEAMQLAPARYGRRYPAELSGGEAQRVSVARALAADPRILLMDEPFGALDPPTRRECQEVLLTAQKELHKTVLFVTHDMDEALLLGSQVALIAKGRLIEKRPPDKLLSPPRSPLVKEFFGPSGVLQVLACLRVRDEMGPPREGGPEVAVDGTLLEALTAMLDAGAVEASVRDEHGALVGSLRFADLVRSGEG